MELFQDSMEVTSEETFGSFLVVKFAIFFLLFFTIMLLVVCFLERKTDKNSSYLDLERQDAENSSRVTRREALRKAIHSI